MSGALIIIELLELDPVLAAASADDRLKEDLLPATAGLTAYLVRTVSSADRVRLSAEPFVRTTERISVTVRAKTQGDRRAAIKRVGRACAGKVGDFAGCFRVSVLSAGRSPTQIGPNNTFEQTHDFTVSFDVLV